MEVGERLSHLNGKLGGFISLGFQPFFGCFFSVAFYFNE
jgi:hypothetical protein